MKRSLSQRFLFVGIGLLLASGCSFSRGNLAHNSDAAHIVDELSAETATPVQTASAELSVEDPNAPPVQPGAKTKSQSKLKNWMKKKDPKRESIPLDRTDSPSDSAEESVADNDEGGIWTHTEAPMTAENSQSRKSKTASFDANPFDQ